MRDNRIGNSQRVGSTAGSKQIEGFETHSGTLPFASSGLKRQRDIDMKSARSGTYFLKPAIQLGGR
jgi:hypothetical protein